MSLNWRKNVRYILISYETDELLQTDYHKNIVHFNV